MAVAEILSDKLNPKLEEKLKFTYDCEDELNELKEMTRAPDIPRVGSYLLSEGATNNSSGDNSSGSDPILPQPLHQQVRLFVSYYSWMPVDKG